MYKLLLAGVLLCSGLQARENPFFPSIGEQDLPYTSNEKNNLKNLKKASVKLPSTARVIKKVTIEYENLDASVETKTIELENKVDWHLPIFISQNYNIVNDTKPTTKKLNITKKPSYDTEINLKKINFLLAQNSFKVITKDKLLRNFLLPQPHRIVLDFKTETNMRYFTKKLKNSIFTKIRIGNHDGYYRVVIELDGYYRYDLKEFNYGYLVTLQ